MGDAGLFHGEAHQPVVQEDGVAGLHVLGELGIGDGAAGLISGEIVGSESKALACFQGDGAGLEGAQPDFRALGVQHGCHGQIQLTAQGFQHLKTAQVLLVAAVGEVEAGHIHTRQKHLPQHALPVGSRAKGTYYLGFPYHNKISLSFIKGRHGAPESRAPPSRRGCRQKGGNRYTSASSIQPERRSVKKKLEQGPRVS